MYKGKYVSVIIAAGGSGTRFGAGDPKQFLDVGGKSMLSAATEKFLLTDQTDQVVITAPKEHIERCCEIIVTDLGASWIGVNDGIQMLTLSMSNGKEIPVNIVSGGVDRAASVRAGLEVVGKEKDAEKGLVLIHDAARPYVSTGLIERVLEAAEQYGAAVPAVAVRDTVYFAGDDGFAETIPDRTRLKAVQTPQGFSFETIKKAHQAAMNEGLTVTDDGMPVLADGGRVVLVEGSHDNKKITIKDDMHSKLGIKSGGDMRIGMGFDAHRFAPDRALILGGIEIPFGKGLLGHSDADVVTHALMDAILGALSEGDIGKIFPDNDPAYEGISSIILLEEVVSLMKKRGYDVVNADITIVAEKPHLSKFREIIEKKLAGVLRTAPENVSVKATTTEKLGFTGREEGIAAEAAILLKMKTIKERQE